MGSSILKGTETLKTMINMDREICRVSSQGNPSQRTFAGNISPQHTQLLNTWIKADPY